MVGFLYRAAIAALGLWLATLWVKGVTIDTPSTLVLAAILLGLANAIVRPIVLILTLPLLLLTLGLFLFVVNALMVQLVAWLLPGFHVSGFWPAFWTALIVTVTGWIGSSLIGPRGRIEIVRHPR